VSNDLLRSPDTLRVNSHLQRTFRFGKAICATQMFEVYNIPNRANRPRFQLDHSLSHFPPVSRWCNLAAGLLQFARYGAVARSSPVSFLIDGITSANCGCCRGDCALGDWRIWSHLVETFLRTFARPRYTYAAKEEF
jgi:hypothetical protein